ncbi:hypothetical protein M6B38_357750 [Iris pallida]|uniref:Uncharacterized protein n=1 Tax=Iris pallida TaxID=29817 RepID=A0AAX6GLP2_IRIPA|nr:hypothetical protein M6B38_357750 [Iris pallida]
MQDLIQRYNGTCSESLIQGADTNQSVQELHGNKGAVNIGIWEECAPAEFATYFGFICIFFSIGCLRCMKTIYIGWICLWLDKRWMFMVGRVSEVYGV